MLRNFFNRQYSQINRQYYWIVLPLWILVSFYSAQLLIFIGLLTANSFSVRFELFDTVIFNSLIAVLMYLLAFSIAVTPFVVLRNKLVNTHDLGLDGLPTWTDIFLAPAGFIIYTLISAVLLMITIFILPSFNINQPQEIGFDKLSNSFELVLGFIILVVIAPFAEEVLFRGFLYGKLRRNSKVVPAIIITSALFGFIHGNLNVVIDTFALSVVLCTLREITGNIWASVLLHMIKNAIAFYILFISPALLTTLVR